MPSHGPLILLQSSHDRAGGIVPPGLLVQAAAEAGYRTAAIIDAGTMRGVPSFLEACNIHHVTGLAGMTVRICPHHSSDKNLVPDVFDLSFPEARGASLQGERIAVLAYNHAGFRNLLKVKRAWDQSASTGIEPGDLLEFTEGLFLVAGLPGSVLCHYPTSRSSSQHYAWMVDFLARWPHDQAGLCCYDGRSSGVIETAACTSHRTPLPVTPLACVTAAYRTQNDRFWGYASWLAREGNLSSRLNEAPGRIPRAERVTRLLQGLSASFRGVEKLTVKPFDPYQRSGLNFPVYPVPRGNDVASFLWTLGQETAIATGHIRREGAKERLVEEFQYLKQTRWPTIWLILWDIRKRLGLPPGTLRPSAEWTTTSLFAHLLGLTRIDPFREGLPFAPGTPAPLHEPIEVDSPHQWEEEIMTALDALLGKGRCGFVAPSLQGQEDLLRDGYRLLSSWEEMEFPGDPPGKVPPLPAFLDHVETNLPTGSPHSLVVSGVNLEQVFPPAGLGYPELDTSLEDALSIGALGLRLVNMNTQTLAAAPLYRGVAREVVSHRQESRESITTWIEKHRGEAFHDQGYADDTGKMEIPGLSSSLLRLLTLPGSTGYRPLLWKWLYTSSPTRLGELADLLALAWHWTYWTQRDTLRLIAVQRGHPLHSEGGMPPWWEDWSRSADESGLDPRIRGDFGSALEKATQGTGGWLLYREQIHQAGASALRLTPGEMDVWLSLEEDSLSPDLRSTQDSRIWDRNTREAVIQFLGNPNPLPTRLGFLRKAEQLLAVADAYSRDPAAVTAILSFLYPDETEERHELYNLLRVRGVRIDSPRVVPGGLYDFSPSEGVLRLGTQNILGVGPQVSVDLEAPFHASPREVRIWDMFQPPSVVTDLHWDEWLQSWPEQHLSWPLLSQLIRLGVFERFGRDSGILHDEARRFHLSRRARSGGAMQHTLFSIPEEPSQARPVSVTETGKPGGKRLELSLLRMGITQSPLEPFREWFPQTWFGEVDIPSGRPDSLLMGWVHEVDVFAAVAEPGSRSETLPVWLTFLLFNHEGVFRIVDESGKLFPLLPVPIPEQLRLDGHRLHLKGPWPLLCEVISRPYTEQGLPLYLLRECEVPAGISATSESWSQIRVVLEDSSADLLDRLSLLLRWFAGTEQGVPLILENGAGIIKRSGVRRLIMRLGPQKVVASTVLISRLQSLRGVASVEVLQRQTELFAAPPESV